MITYKKGDLLLSDCPIIVHGCNCQGKMGKGIAKAIKDRYPEVFTKYHEYINSYYMYHKEDDKLLGFNQLILVNDKSRIIINSFTQEYYGKDKRFTSYDAVDDCMMDIAAKIPYSKKIGMTKIGCVNGGGNWNVVEAIINHRLEKFDIEVYEL